MHHTSLICFLTDFFLSYLDSLSLNWTLVSNWLVDFFLFSFKWLHQRKNPLRDFHKKEHNFRYKVKVLNLHIVYLPSLIWIIVSIVWSVTVNIEIRRVLFDSIVVPTLIYTSEAVIWKSRIHTVEMSYLWGSDGVNRIDGDSTESVWKVCYIIYKWRNELWNGWGQNAAFLCDWSLAENRRWIDSTIISVHTTVTCQVSHFHNLNHRHLTFIPCFICLLLSGLVTIMRFGCAHFTSLSISFHSSCNGKIQLPYFLLGFSLFSLSKEFKRAGISVN